MCSRKESQGQQIHESGDFQLVYEEWKICLENRIVKLQNLDRRTVVLEKAFAVRVANERTFVPFATTVIDCRD